MDTIKPDRREKTQEHQAGSGWWSPRYFARLFIGLATFAQSASAASLLQVYCPLQVGDHYRVREGDRTNYVTIEAGDARYMGSFKLNFARVTAGGITNFSWAYVGYSGGNRLTYEVPEHGYSPPLIDMTETALASPGMPFAGLSYWTNFTDLGGFQYYTYTSQSVTGVVSQTGGITASAGTFKNCLQVDQTEVTRTTISIAPDQTQAAGMAVRYYLAANVGMIKVEAAGKVVYDLLDGVIGGVDIRTLASGGNSRPPVVTAHPQGANIPVGGDATLSAAGSGAAPIFFQWFKNGQPVAGANQASLTLQNAQAAQSGYYSLLASNHLGQVMSDEAALTVGTTPLPAKFVVRVEANAALLSVIGTVGKTYQIEAASQLSGGGWQPWKSVTLGPSVERIADPILTPSAARYYRAWTSK